MLPCICRTGALQAILQDLAGLSIGIRASGSANTSQSLRQSNAVLRPSNRRNHYTQTEHPRASGVANGSRLDALSNLNYDASTWRIDGRPLQRDPISASAVKRSFRTAEEEAARREKRLAKKMERVKSNTFPRNKHRIRALDEMYGLSNTTKIRLQHRYHSEWVQRQKALRRGKSSSPSEDDAELQVSKRYDRPGPDAAKKSDRKTPRTRIGVPSASPNAASSAFVPVQSVASESIDDVEQNDLTVQNKLEASPVTASSESVSVQSSALESIDDAEEEDLIVQSMLEDIRLGRKPSHIESSAVDTHTTIVNPADGPITTPATASEDQAAEVKKDTPIARTRPAWAIKKETLREKFGAEGWAPRKKLSPDSLNGIRALHESNPELYTIPVLAAHLMISPEAIYRILKSKWRPKEKEIEDRRARWTARGKRKREAINQHKERKSMARAVRRHDLYKDFSATFGDDLRTRRRLNDPRSRFVMP